MAGEAITLKSQADGFELGAWRVAARGQRRGGLVLAQEIFGVTDGIRKLCEDYAGEGYDVIAPSFYDRHERDFVADYGPEDRPRAIAAMSAVDWSLVTGDLQAAVDALEGPVCVTGYCWGGTAAWVAACRCSGVAAASGYYGRLIVDFLEETPRVPLILHYGRHDGSIPMADVERVRATGKASAVYVYDAGHGFCSDRADHFDAAACSLARARTLALFADPGRIPD